tara:strand:- start:16853 stop:18034 length:1182 start_codon:yes stop_codon:yes gene_type:complete
MQNKTLYISYNGLLEPLGQSQIIPYIEILSKFTKISIISIENQNSLFYKSKQNLRSILKKKKIQWKFFNRNNFSTFKNIFIISKIIFTSIFLMYKKKINIVHARSFIPGLIGFVLKKINPKIKLIYDIRGFWIDEKIDRTKFTKNYFYNFLIFLDKCIYKNSDRIICLTNHSRLILIKKYNFIKKSNIFIIPTCGDHNNFFPVKNLNNKQIQFCYVGSVGGAYDFYKVVSFILEIYKNTNENIFFSIINTSQHNKIKSIMDKINFPRNLYKISESNREDISSFINSSDIGCFYANENFSIKASFPTRIAEFLLSGKPILCNSFNDDVIDMIDNNNIGIISDFKLNYEPNYYTKIINYIKKSRDNRQEIRKFAIDNLSLKYAENKLSLIYGSIN